MSSLTVNEYHFQLMKLFTVKNNYLPSTKIFTSIELFTVNNNNNLPLIKKFNANRIIYG